MIRVTLKKEVMVEREVQDALAFGLMLVRTTRAKVRQFSQAALATESKSDGSPVTVLDREIEQLICAEIRRRFPSHGIIGEEGGAVETTTEWTWTIDPIDGTQNLAVGVPTYATIIALLRHGRPVVGVIDHPQLDLTYYAALGGGAFCNGARLAVEDSRRIVEIVATDTRGCFERGVPRGACFDALHREFPSARVFYDCFAHTQTAHGRLAACVVMSNHLWDVTASQLLVEEAGGVHVALKDCAGAYSAVLGREDVVRRILSVLAAHDVVPSTRMSL